MPDKTAFLCPCCGTETKVSATELYDFKKINHTGLVCCSICGSANINLLVEKVPEIADLSLEQWSEKLPYDGENNWIPCQKFEGPEAKLVSGCYIVPGNELTPRLWIYKVVVGDGCGCDSVRDFSWEAYVRGYNCDPFIKLYRMRMPGNRNWLRFITKGAAEKLEDMHLRTRILSR